MAEPSSTPPPALAATPPPRTRAGLEGALRRWESMAVSADPADRRALREDLRASREALAKQDEEEHRTAALLRKVRLGILVGGFAVAVLACTLWGYRGKNLVYGKDRRLRWAPIEAKLRPRFIVTVFLTLSAAVLYAGALVPQIVLFRRIRARGTNGIMTSFLALAMVAVIVGLAGKSASLVSAYKSDGTNIVLVWLSIGVVVLPFMLHVWMIRQISLYNDDSTPTSAASKRAAKWAWITLLVVYIAAWVTMAVVGSRASRKKA